MKSFSISKTISQSFNYMTDWDFLSKEFVADLIYTIFVGIVMLFILSMLVVETGVNLMKMLSNPMEYYKGIMELLMNNIPVKTIVILAIWLFLIGPIIAWHYNLITSAVALLPKKNWEGVLERVFILDWVTRIKGIILWNIYTWMLFLVVGSLMVGTILVLGKTLMAFVSALIWPLLLFPFAVATPQFYFFHLLNIRKNRVALKLAILDTLENYIGVSVIILIINGILFLINITSGFISTIIKATVVGVLPGFAIDYLVGWYTAQLYRASFASIFKQLHPDNKPFAKKTLAN